MTVAEAARRLGVSRQRVFQLLTERRLRGMKLEPATWLVEAASVEERVTRPKSRGGRPRKADAETVSGEVLAATV